MGKHGCRVEPQLQSQILDPVLVSPPVHCTAVPQGPSSETRLTEGQALGHVGPATCARARSQEGRGRRFLGRELGTQSLHASGDLPPAASSTPAPTAPHPHWGLESFDPLVVSLLLVPFMYLSTSFPGPMLCRDPPSGPCPNRCPRPLFRHVGRCTPSSGLYHTSHLISPQCHRATFLVDLDPALSPRTTSAASPASTPPSPASRSQACFLSLQERRGKSEGTSLKLPHAHQPCRLHPM